MRRQIQRGCNQVNGFRRTPQHSRQWPHIQSHALILVSSPVTFAYDAAGNRSSMSDGSGSVSYQYNQLSQLTSEARQFSSPGPTGTYTLSYSYSLAGSAKSITDPAGAAINYSYDPTGRTNAVTGSSFGGVTQYATNMKYRAWGDVKEMSYGNSHTVSASYNARLQPTHFEIPGVMAKDYQYQADGRIRYSADLLDSRFDRSYGYDHAGRIKEAFSGPLARGEADSTNRPYKEFFQYDAMDHLVGRVGSRHWSQALPNAGVTDSFVNNRNPNWQYDADGHLTNGANIQSTFDAAGRAVTVVSNAGNQTQTRLYDGDGRQSKLVEVSTQDDGGGPYTTTTVRYSLSSSVVGDVITELDETGQKTRSFVYNRGQVLAWQQKSATFEQVSWEYRDASDASYRMATANGAIDEERSAEKDPLGSNAGATTPYSQSSHQHWPGEDGIYPGFADLTNQDCYMNGIPSPCDLVYLALRSEAGKIDPTRTPPSTAERLGALPIVGRFCVTVTSGGVTEMKCTTEITGYHTPSFSPHAGNPQNSDFDMPGIAKLVDLELADSDCLKFAQTILNQLSPGKGGSLTDVFNAFLDQPKPHDLFTRERPVGSRGEATGLGSLKNSTAAMYLSTKILDQTVADADNVIQELFHFAGNGYSDEQLARALRKTQYATEESQPFPDGTANIFDKRYIAGGWSKADGYSTYFHAIARIHCGLRGVSIKKNYKK